MEHPDRWALDLGFLVPLEPGAIVGISKGPPVVRHHLSLGAAEMRDLRPPDVWPVGGAELDHAVLIDVARQDLRAAVVEAARAIRPGGSLVLGVGRRVLVPAGVHGLVARLAGAGFEAAQAYGVHPSVEEPAALVPLGGHGPAQTYWSGMVFVASSKAALAQQAAPLLVRLHLAHLLFDSVFLAARRAT